MAPRKRILFLGESASLAHVTRPLVLASAVDPTAYEVHVGFDERHRSLFDSVPDARFHHLAGTASERFVREARGGGFTPQPEEVEAAVEDELALLEEIRPSLVLSDFRHSATISAALRHVPLAALANAYWSPYRDLGFDPTAPIPGPGLLGRLRRRLTPGRVRSTTASLNIVRSRHALPPLEDYLDLATHGTYTLYTEPEGLVPTKELPETHAFLGPVLWSPQASRPKWWNAWDTELPVIYLTMGSTGASSLLPGLANALAALPATVLASTAGRVRIHEPPERVYVADYLPGIELSRLADLVVCNGGSPTAYQALQAGTPVLGLWSNIDQYLNMMTIVRRGAGRAVQVDKAEPANIADVCEELLGAPAFRVAAEELAQLFGRYDARARFRDLLPRMVDAGGPAES